MSMDIVQMDNVRLMYFYPFHQFLCLSIRTKAMTIK